MREEYLPEVRDRAVRMVLDPADDHDSMTAACHAVAARLGISRETLRRWVAQARINAGDRPGATTTESDELKAIKAENKRLREANEDLAPGIHFLRAGTRPAPPLKASNAIFAARLDPSRESTGECSKML